MLDLLVLDQRFQNLPEIEWRPGESLPKPAKFMFIRVGEWFEVRLACLRPGKWQAEIATSLPPISGGTQVFGKYCEVFAETSLLYFECVETASDLFMKQVELPRRDADYECIKATEICPFCGAEDCQWDCELDDEADGDEFICHQCGWKAHDCMCQKEA